MAEPEAPEGTWPKFGAPATQLEREKKITTIQLTGLQKEKETIKWLQEQIDPRSTVEPGIKEGYKRQLAAIRRKQTERMVEAEFGKDFRKWLQGQSEYNVVHYTDSKPGTDGRPLDVKRLCTPWGNKDLTKLPGVAEFLDTGITGRAQTIQDLTTLRMKGPTDINDAYIYYKYIVRGFGIDGDAVHEMEEFSHYLDPPPAAYAPNPDGGEPIPVIHDRDLEDGPGPQEDWSDDVFIPWNQTDQRAKYYAKFTEENRAAASKRVTDAIAYGIPPAEVDLNLIDERTYVHARFEKMLTDIRTKPAEERDEYMNSFYYELSEHIDMDDVIGNDFFEPHLDRLRRMGAQSTSPVTGHGTMADDPEMIKLMKNRRRSFALDNNVFNHKPTPVLVEEEHNIEKDDAFEQSADALDASVEDTTEANKTIENEGRLPPADVELLEFGDIAADVVDIENRLFGQEVVNRMGMAMVRLVGKSNDDEPDLSPEALGLFAAVQKYAKEIALAKDELLFDDEYGPAMATIHNSNVINLSLDKSDAAILGKEVGENETRFANYIATLIDKYIYKGKRDVQEQTKMFAELYTTASEFIENTKGSKSMTNVLEKLKDEQGNPHPIANVIVPRAIQMMISGEGEFNAEKLRAAKTVITEGRMDDVTLEHVDAIAYALSRGGLPMRLAHTNAENISASKEKYELKQAPSPNKRITMIKEAFFNTSPQVRLKAARTLMGYKKEFEKLKEF